jgi:capsular exopolysaccharide synthesis family protein
MAQYELNVLDYWLIVKKRKYTIAATAALVIACTILLTQIVTPDPVYESSARVKFDRASSVANLLIESLSAQGGNDLATQTEVIRSFPVIEHVAVKFKMVPDDLDAGTRQSRAYLSTMYALQQRIKASQEGATNIIKISAAAESPDQAAQLANAVTEAYRMENIASQNRVVNESRKFVEEQLVILQGKLKDAEEVLLRFKEKEGQVFLSEEARVALETFTKLEGEYDHASRLKDEAVKQIAAFQQAGDEGRAGDRIFTEEPMSVLSVLNTRLTNLQQERATLLINYSSRHPQVKEVDRKIAYLRADIIRELESKIKSLTDRQTALTEQIAVYRSRYFGFPKAAVELARLEREVKVTSDLYATLKTRHQELLVKGSQQIQEVTILEPALPPAAPVNAPDTAMNLIVSTLMGLVLGIVLAFARESFDTSIGTIEGVEEFLKVPVLGVIPQFTDKMLEKDASPMLPPDANPDVVEMLSKLVCLYSPKSVLAEAYRALRTNIQFSVTGRGDFKTLLFTSAGLGEGKTTTIVNVALAMAQDGKRVLLVDADMRRPVIHARFGLQREPGLSEVLTGSIQWKDAVRTVTDLMIGTLGVDRVMSAPGLDNLHILTSGKIPMNPAELLDSSKATELIAELRKSYDLVLLDTPPILPIADAVAMSSRADGTVLVYQVGRIGRTALKRTKFLLEHAQAKVLGLVLTNVRSEVTPEYGYYRYEYR